MILTTADSPPVTSGRRDCPGMCRPTTALRRGTLADHSRRAQANPPDLWVVLSESVLRVQVGGSAVMRAQLRRLIDVAERSNVTMQVLPFTTAAHVQPISAFTILEFPDAADPTVVYLEHLTGNLFLESQDEVRRYTVIFDHLRAEALGTGQSIGLIAHVAAEMT